MTFSSFIANDGTELTYHEEGPKSLQPNGHIPHQDHGPYSEKVIILIHGWTGASSVWMKNVNALAAKHRLIGVDLRGHGGCEKASGNGHHLSRLGMDLKNLIDHLQLPEGQKIVGVGASLGCAVLWSYIELFTASAFSDLIFVDQSPRQNYSADGSWGAEHGSKGCNSAETLAHLQASLNQCPDKVYAGLAETCLAYRSHPTHADDISPAERARDDAFFLELARRCDPRWLGTLMAEHSALDWRELIVARLGQQCMVRILVVASSRSGCFHAAGPRWIDKAIRESRHRYPEGEARVKGVTVDWGGHWCYWENSREFNRLVLDFLAEDPEEVERQAQEVPV